MRSRYLTDLHAAVGVVRALVSAGQIGMKQALLDAAALYNVSIRELTHMVQAGAKS